jgi:hypothetical protein
VLYLKINKKYHRVVNINEAKQILRVTRQYILKIINKSWIRAVKYGKDYFIIKSDLLKIKRG